VKAEGRKPVQIAFHADSSDGDTHGTFTFNDRRAGITLHAMTLGKLQVSTGWATVTGRGTIAGERDERSFFIIVDQHDALVHGQPTVTINIQGGYTFKGVLSQGESQVATR
jgi:hypothetical protein